MIVEVVVICISGTATALGLGCLWFSRWFISTERAEQEKLAKEEKSREEALKREIDEADPEKTAAKKAAAEKATAEAQSFRSFDDTLCPRCGIKMKYRATPPTYCECNKVLRGHYHHVCNVTEPVRNKLVGCSAAWIMLAKDTK